MNLGSSLKRRRKSRNASANQLRLLAWAGGVGLFGLLLGYTVATRILFPAPPPPPDLEAVPDLRGGTLDLARNLAEAADLRIGQVEYLRHPEADSGLVLGQSPLPGQLAPPGDSVRVTVSLGPEVRTVPAVSRLAADQAVTLLRATGFRVRVDSVESVLPRGRILWVEPGEGDELALPGVVGLRVSLGPPLVSMPSVLGMSEDVARDTLDALGLVVSEAEEVFRFGRDQGRVVGQDPPAEELVERGTAVRLVVGRRSGSRRGR